jgi:hypothetical protein
VDHPQLQWQQNIPSKAKPFAVLALRSRLGM